MIKGNVKIDRKNLISILQSCLVLILVILVTLMIVRNMALENVVIEYRDRPSGSESKLNTYSDGIKVMLTIFRLLKNYKPTKFFGIIALILAIIRGI